MKKLIRLIAEKKKGAPRLLVTLDGPCASGKTTLAESLAEALGAAVVHTDDFVVPHAMKTKERLAIPGGNCDAERLVSEVLAPWKQGRTGRFRRYDCRRDCLLPEEDLPGDGVLILEGSYCNLPAIRALADLRIFMDTAEEIREKRLRERESEASLQRFRELWIPLENAYFGAYGLPDEGCVVYPGRQAHIRAGRPARHANRHQRRRIQQLRLKQRKKPFPASRTGGDLP